MKRVLLILLLFPFKAFNQITTDPQKELATIAAQEMKSAEGFMKTEMSSAASNNFDIHYLRCEWNIDPAVNFIAGKITSHFVMTSTGNLVTLDCANQLTVDSVLYHGAKISFQQKAGNILDVTFPSNINSGARDSFTVCYQGVPPGTGLGSFFQGTHSGVPVIWTLSEPYGAKDWWPCKNGQQDKADSIDIYITHPSVYMASSNGMMVDQFVGAGYRISHFQHRYPIASYLIALSVTNFVRNNDTIQVEGKTIPLISYAYPEGAGSIFGQEIFTKQSMRALTKFFGEYPFIKEKYGHTQWNWPGGMEHQTNTFIVNTSPNISAHELGHQWFGDKVTCRSWAHIWLNEGFATYATAIFLEDQYPTFYIPYMRSALNNIVSSPGGSVFVPDTSDVNRIFSNRLTYNKGSYVVHMLRWILGDSLFKKGLQQYQNDPQLAYGTALTADLQRNLEQVSGKNLTSFFQKWVYGEGYANYNALWSQNNNNWANLELQQTTSHASVSFYDMPVQLVFSNATQSKTFVVDHKFSGQRFSLDVGFVADTVIIDPNIWILARTKTSQKIPASTTASDDVLIYPNPSPSNGNVVVRNPTGTSISVQLFNSIGQILFAKQVQTIGADEFMTLPLTRYARGVYWVRVRNDKGLNIVRKIVH
ncbi:MAG TPA: M1 family aminopeptidase [Chitinophagaceae bacterium]|nr:M1 family aminopeptidase [Chitinophagaceae bacterium]